MKEKNENGEIKKENRKIITNFEYKNNIAEEPEVNIIYSEDQNNINFMSLELLISELNDNNLSKSNKNINYNVSAYDNESGLYGYKEINETETCPDEKDEYIQNKKIVLQENGKRKICLIDNVGNKNEIIINVEKIDKSDINCEFIVANSPTIGEKVGNRQWYKSTTEIRLNALNIGISGVTLGIENIQEKDFLYNSTNTFISETIEKK